MGDSDEDDDDDSINDFWGELPSFENDENNGNNNADGSVDKLPRAEHILVLLDCAPDMFVPSIPVKTTKHRNFEYEATSTNPDDHNIKDDKQQQGPLLVTPVDAVVKALQEYVRQSVRTSVQTKSMKKNGFGLSCYGTRKRSRLTNNILKDDGYNGTGGGGDNTNSKPGGSDSENDSDSSDYDSEDSEAVHKRRVKSSRSSSETTVHHLIPIAPPGIDTVKRLRQCLPDPHHGNHRVLDLQKEFGHDNNNNNDNNDNEKDKSKHNNNNDTSEGEAAAEAAEFLLTALNDVALTFREAKCVKTKLDKKMLERYAPDTKTLWIFTNQDDPCKGDSERRTLLVNTAQDLKDNGYTIKLWPLPNQNRNHPFNGDIFFQQIAEIPLDVAVSNNNNHEIDLDAFMAGQWKTVRRTVQVPLLFPDQVPRFKKEYQNSTTSNNGDDGEADAGAVDDDDDKGPPGIALDFFLPVSLQSEPAKVKILRQVGMNDNETVELQRITYQSVKEKGEILATSKPNLGKEERAQQDQQPKLARLRTYHKLGNDFIPIQREELAELRKRSNLNRKFASLVLLGFKNPNAVPDHFNMKSYFVYPNEAVEGSTAAFAHLHQSMMKKNVIGIGELLERKNYSSKLVAIHAVPEEVDEVGGDGDSDDGDNIISFPPGWIVTVLPFENEVRAMVPDESLEETFEVPPQVLEATENLVSKMFGDEIDLGAFPNPYLDKFWDYIESIALQEPMPMDKDYCLAPIDDATLKDLHKHVEALKLTLPVDEDRKRKSVATKLKADDSTDWEREFRNGNLRLYVVDSIKAGLKKYNVKLGGKTKKDDLVNMLSDAISSSL